MFDLRDDGSFDLVGPTSRVEGDVPADGRDDAPVDARVDAVFPALL